MHRELSNTDEVFQSPHNLSLYLMTGVIGALIFLDLWPALAAWLRDNGIETLTWDRSFQGYRYALIAAVLGGARVLYGSLESLLDGRLGADLALGIACIAAILIREPLVAAEVVFIGLVGECLEAFTFARTQRAVGQLVELFPKRCWLLRDGQEVRVFTTDVQVGDQVVVKPGAKVPVDGIIIAGQSAVNVAALTGESLPIEKGIGEEVLAGSINQTGALTIEAKRVQKETVAGQVIEWTGKALKDKAPIERHADRLAALFLPIVLALAALTFIGNLIYYAGPFRPEAMRLTFGAAARISVYPTLAVLVVACPCALILATPAAVIAALGRLAGTGVLIKSGSALERLAATQAIAFDKTGTLTEAKLELGDLLPLPDIQPDELLRIAATAEQGSEHPLGRLLLQATNDRQLTLEPLTGFTASPGGGVTAQTSNETIRVGTRRFMEQLGITIPPEAIERLNRIDDSGQTSLFVARNERIIGVIGARDRVRPEAAGVLAELEELGIRDRWLLTGDRRAVAATVHQDVPGLTKVFAELLPTEKSVKLEEWSNARAAEPSPTASRWTGKPLPGQFIMVGDGINDAPSLAKAGVGIAIGSGTEIAAEAGDVVMMGEPLRPIPFLIRLSRETVRIIRQNILFFAFTVNFIGIALTGWLWPLFGSSPDWYEKAPLAGVVYHQLGSLLVLLNSMRLLAFERGSTSKAGIGDRLRTIDGWMDRNLRLDDLLHEAGHHWKRLLIGGAALVLSGWLLSGFVRIEPQEVGIVQRFGQVTEVIEPGLSWRFPWPIDRITRIQPDMVRSVEVGFRSAPETDKPTANGLTWASSHTEGSRRISDEAVMITGDGNLVEVLATVRYSIADPKQFLFGVRDPESVLRWSAESVLREMVAAQPFLELLTIRRAEFQQEAQTRLERRCRELGTDGLGIRLDGMTLHDLHPPQEVVAAYHEVARAMELRDRLINEATADASRTRGRANEDAYSLTRNAEVAANEKVSDAKATRDVFLAWHQARTTLSPAQEVAMWFAFHAAPPSAEGIWFAGLYRIQRQERLAAQRFLSEFRLQLDTLTAVLRKRDKILIDSGQLPGKRQLFLLDPDALRLPAAIAPTERGTRPIRPSETDNP